MSAYKSSFNLRLSYGFIKNGGTDMEFIDLGSPFPARFRLLLSLFLRKWLDAIGYLLNLESKRGYSISKITTVGRGFGSAW